MFGISFGSIVLFALGVVVCITLINSVKIVSQSKSLVIERLGKYNRTLSGGIFFTIPFIDTVRARFNLEEQIYDIRPQVVITKDNVTIKVDGLVYVRITNSYASTYEVLDVQNAISNLAQTTLRGLIGTMDLEDCNSHRDEMNMKLTSALDEASDGWGAKVARVEISDISVPKNIQQSMELQMTAERNRRATETEAQGKKKAAILEAEGEKEAAVRQAEGLKEAAFLEAEARERTAEAAKFEEIRRGEGIKESMQQIAEAIKENPDSAQFTLNQERIAAFGKLAASDSANKIVVPTETADMLGLVKGAMHAVSGKSA